MGFELRPVKCSGFERGGGRFDSLPLRPYRVVLSLSYVITPANPSVLLHAVPDGGVR